MPESKQPPPPENARAAAESYVRQGIEIMQRTGAAPDPFPQDRFEEVVDKVVKATKT